MHQSLWQEIQRTKQTGQLQMTAFPSVSLALSFLQSVREHNPLVYRILGRARVKCENHEGGCSWQGELSELAIHLAGCPQTMVRCEDCGARVPREQMDVHHFQCTRQCEVRLETSEVIRILPC